jgi:ABC-type nitrate/sulfonate/bicarbonate transport system ATPase subunit
VGARLSVSEVWKTYEGTSGSVSALEGMSLTVEDGEFVAIVGPSGCGKSTLLNVIAGFERCERGQVLVGGQPVLAPSRRGIMITQRGSVFPWMTVAQNLDLALDGAPKAERHRKMTYYVDLVGLAGCEARYPHELSGGMLQRVEVARALLAAPDLLYMDEPFAALDALTRFRMRTELRRILTRDRHTCVLVTHDVDEALDLADRIYVMTPRPGKTQSILDVRVPHPRHISNPELVRLKERILTGLGLLSAATPASRGDGPVDLPPVVRAADLPSR